MQLCIDPLHLASTMIVAHTSYAFTPLTGLLQRRILSLCLHIAGGARDFSLARSMGDLCQHSATRPFSPSTASRSQRHMASKEGQTTSSASALMFGNTGKQRFYLD